MKGIKPDEIGNTYLCDADRFVVSLVVGYEAGDGVSGPRTPAEAVLHALNLTRDQEDGSFGTHWYCIDRKTG